MDLPKLYNQLSEWWPLMSAPADYAEEATVYSDLFFEGCSNSGVAAATMPLT
jgi:hypothetical protein